MQFTKKFLLWHVFLSLKEEKTEIDT